MSILDNLKTDVQTKVINQYKSNKGFNKNTLKNMADEVHGIVIRFNRGSEIQREEITQLLIRYMDISTKAKQAAHISPIYKKEALKFAFEIDNLVSLIRSDLSDKNKYTLLENGNYVKVINNDK